MESLPNGSSGLSSYYQARNPTTTFPAAAAANVSPTNGVLPNAANSHPTTTAAPNGAGPLVVHTGSVQPGGSSTPEVPKRKRGRPRKFLVPEQENGMSLAASALLSPSTRRRNRVAKGGQAVSLSKGTSQPCPLGESKKGFIPHIIHVAAGEDVGKKIMLFLQERKSDICIISASGSICLACLRQPSPSGGITTYEGKFKILSLTGSFVHPRRGVRTGGICVSLAYPDGRIIGSGVTSHLIAAGPTKVIVATFVVGSKKIFYSERGRAKSSQIGRLPAPSFGFESMVNYSRLSSEGSQFVMQPQGMESPPLYLLEWRGNTDHAQATHQSPEIVDLDLLDD